MLVFFSVFRRLNRFNSSDDCFILNKRKDKFNIRVMLDLLNILRFYFGYLNRGNNFYYINDSDYEFNIFRDSEMFRFFFYLDLQRLVFVLLRILEDSFIILFNSSKVEKVELNDKKFSFRVYFLFFYFLRFLLVLFVVNYYLEFDADDFDFFYNISGMGGLIERFEQDYVLRIFFLVDVIRRYFEGYFLFVKVREIYFYFRNIFMFNSRMKFSCC